MAKSYIQEALSDEYGETIKVYILADLLQITDKSWQNAVEGYMGNHKLSLIVEPKYTKAAIEIYHSMDEKKYHKVSVIDAERVLKSVKPVLEHSLAEVIDSDKEYAKAFVDYLMGSVIRCGKPEQLRQNKSAVTKDCLLYHNYKLQHINPKNYTEFAYIGNNSIEQRRSRLELRLLELKDEMSPYQVQLKKYQEMLTYEGLLEDIEVYEKYVEDSKKIQARLVEKESLEIKINELKSKDVDHWKEKKQELELEIKKKTEQKEVYGNESRV